MSDDRRRHALCLPCLPERCADLVKIMRIIQIDHMEIERFKLLVDRIWRTNILDPAVDLQPVVIHDHAEVVELSVPCKHGSLPDLSFLDLAVAEQCVHSVVRIGHLRPKCHAARYGDPLSERAG